MKNKTLLKIIALSLPFLYMRNAYADGIPGNGSAQVSPTISPTFTNTLSNSLISSIAAWTVFILGIAGIIVALCIISGKNNGKKH